MSKVIAYRCDFCGQIKEDKQMVGLNPTEDMFSKLDSFPAINTNKTDVHHCLDCYRNKVLLFVDKLINRRKSGEQVYRQELKTLYYSFKAKCISNHRLKVFTDKRKKADEYPGYWKNKDGQPIAESE